MALAVVATFTISASHASTQQTPCAVSDGCNPRNATDPAAASPQPLINVHAKLKHGIDRSQFSEELREHPELILKMSWMVNGEIGRNAPLEAKIVQLETLFNRAQARGQSLARNLLSVTEDPNEGYYAGKSAPGGGTYSPAAKPTPAEVQWFKDNVLSEVMRGSNLSDHGNGPMTGNASGDVAQHEFKQGISGYKLAGGDSYFREGPFEFPFPAPQALPASQGQGGVSVAAAATLPRS
jgi:hypothetical protein